jgi:hypothetical protein
VSDYPGVDESFGRLHRAGWSLGEYVLGPPHAPVWCVEGVNGENRIDARGGTQAETWWRACEQARAVGMLAGVRPPPRHPYGSRAQASALPRGSGSGAAPQGDPRGRRARAPGAARGVTA